MKLPLRAAAGVSPNAARIPRPIPLGCPGGIAENRPAFQLKRWVRTPEGLSPEGTADSPPIQPSLRNSVQSNLLPSVETLGYSHPSLRDEQDQILVALGILPAVELGILPGGSKPFSRSAVKARLSSSKTAHHQIGRRDAALYVRQDA